MVAIFLFLRYFDAWNSQPRTYYANNYYRPTYAQRPTPASFCSRARRSSAGSIFVWLSIAFSQENASSVLATNRGQQNPLPHRLEGANMKKQKPS
ncbi:MAG TPA: hypothetical protein VJH94_03020 [Candidatus Paceibacterota bacterium]